MTKELNIKSSTLEKGLEIATQFLDALIIPSISEVGLLLKDKVSFWRFNNQIKMLNRAKEICDKNNINPKEISLKILCPLLDYAGLEEDVELQEKWSILLSNMVDSNQNIQNHVFPYLLSQISLNEFDILFDLNTKKQQRVEDLTKVLQQFLHEKPNLIQSIQDNYNQLPEDVRSRKLWSLSNELASIENKEKKIRQEILRSEKLVDSHIKDFEISNLVRLGVLKTITQHWVNSEPIKIEPYEQIERYGKMIELDISVEPDEEELYLTELGEMFIKACTEKKEKMI
ncbi:MAG: hypothetical protein RL110_844 [Bacteroidota bacterium]|jgi:hypothetical protein